MRLFGNLIDEWDNEAARAAATIPLLMAGAAGLRAVGTVIGESMMAKVSFNMVFNLRQQLFEQLLHYRLTILTPMPRVISYRA